MELLDVRAEDWHPLLRLGRALAGEEREALLGGLRDLPRYLKASHRHLPPLPHRNRLLLRFLNVAATQEAHQNSSFGQNFFFHQRVQLNDSSASNGSFICLSTKLPSVMALELLALLPPFFSCVHYNEGATRRNASQSRKPKHPGLGNLQKAWLETSSQNPLPHFT